MLFVVVVLRFMDAFRKFEGIQQLTSGGPGLASTPINLHIYNTGLFYHQVGYAAAWGIVMVVHDRRCRCCLVYLARRRVRDEAPSTRRVAIVGRPSCSGGLVFVVVPYLWIVLTAFKRPVDAAAVPPMIFSPITIRTARSSLTGPFPGSLVRVGDHHRATTVATLVLGVPAGYAFARGRFRGPAVPRRLAAVQPDGPAGHLHHPAVPVLPPAPAGRHVPGPDPRLHDRAAAVHGLDVRPRTSQDIPIELEEAARVDGASRFRAFLPSCCRSRCRAS